MKVYLWNFSRKRCLWEPEVFISKCECVVVSKKTFRQKCMFENEHTRRYIALQVVCVCACACVNAYILAYSQLVLFCCWSVCVLSLSPPSPPPPHTHTPSAGSGPGLARRGVEFPHCAWIPVWRLGDDGAAAALLTHTDATLLHYPDCGQLSNAKWYGSSA